MNDQLPRSTLNYLQQMKETNFISKNEYPKRLTTTFDSKACEVQEKLKSIVQFQHKKEMMNQTLQFKKDPLPPCFSELSSRNTRYNRNSHNYSAQPPQTGEMTRRSTRYERLPTRVAQRTLNSSELNGPRCVQSFLDARVESRCIRQTQNVNTSPQNEESLLSEPIEKYERNDNSIDSDKEIERNETIYIEPLSSTNKTPFTPQEKGNQQRAYLKSLEINQKQRQHLIPKESEQSQKETVEVKVDNHLEEEKEANYTHTTYSLYNSHNALQPKPLRTYRKKKSNVVENQTDLHSHQSMVDPTRLINAQTHVVTKYFCEPARTHFQTTRHQTKQSRRRNTRTSEFTPRQDSVLDSGRVKRQFVTALMTQKIELGLPARHLTRGEGITRQGFEVTSNEQIKPSTGGQGLQVPHVYITRNERTPTRILNLSLPFNRSEERHQSQLEKVRQRFGNTLGFRYNPRRQTEDTVTTVQARSKVASEDVSNMLESTEREPIKLNLEIKPPANTDDQRSRPSSNDDRSQEKIGADTQLQRDQANTPGSFTSEESRQIRAELLNESKRWHETDQSLPSTPGIKPTLDQVRVSQTQDTPFRDRETLLTQQIIQEHLTESKIDVSISIQHSNESQSNEPLEPRNPQLGKIGIPLFVPMQTETQWMSDTRKRQISRLRIKQKEQWVKQEANQIRNRNPTQLPLVSQSVTLKEQSYWVENYQQMMVLSPKKYDLSYKQPAHKMILKDCLELKSGKSSQLSTLRDRMQFLSTGSDFKERIHLRKTLLQD